MTRDMYSR